MLSLSRAGGVRSMWQFRSTDQHCNSSRFNERAIANALIEPADGFWAVSRQTGSYGGPRHNEKPGESIFPTLANLCLRTSCLAAGRMHSFSRTFLVWGLKEKQLVFNFLGPVQQRFKLLSCIAEICAGCESG